MALEACCGCGGLFEARDGPTHAYMLSSPACWARFGEVLARDYATPALMPTHRLSVDAYAVQHPGDPNDRRAVQSVGLHLARLSVQLAQAPGPRDTNDVMLAMGRRKATLPVLSPPARFDMTVADFPLDGGDDAHVEAVRRWAAAAWAAWSPHHAFIRSWAERARGG